MARSPSEITRVAVPETVRSISGWACVAWKLEHRDAHRVEAVAGEGHPIRPLGDGDLLPDMRQPEPVGSRRRERGVALLQRVGGDHEVGDQVVAGRLRVAVRQRVGERTFRRDVDGRNGARRDPYVGSGRHRGDDRTTGEVARPRSRPRPRAAETTTAVARPARARRGRPSRGALTTAALDERRGRGKRARVRRARRPWCRTRCAGARRAARPRARPRRRTATRATRPGRGLGSVIMKNRNTRISGEADDHPPELHAADRADVPAGGHAVAAERRPRRARPANVTQNATASAEHAACGGDRASRRAMMHHDGDQRRRHRSPTRSPAGSARFEPSTRKHSDQPEVRRVEDVAAARRGSRTSTATRPPAVADEDPPARAVLHQSPWLGARAPAG